MIIQNYQMKNKIFYLILFMFINIGCLTKNIDFKKGHIISSNNKIQQGYVHIDECHDTFLQYKNSINDTAKIIQISDIQALKAGKDSFIVIKKREVKDIITRYYNYKNDIIAKVEEFGEVLLLSHCVIDYSSSMFTTEKFIAYGHILVTKGKSNYNIIRHNPKDFFQIAEIFFTDNYKLMDEILNANYNTKIIHTDSGDTSNYETVSVKQITDYVKDYNNWIIENQNN